MTPKEYVEAVNEKYQTGSHVARELSYRGILENFIKSFGVTTVSEAEHIECGAPDITIYNQNQNVIGFIETKDIDNDDLDGKRRNKDQFNRYKDALGNLIFTDYLDFHFYDGQEFLCEIRIGKLVNDKIIYLPENEDRFLSFINKFTCAKPQKITSTAKLAEILAHKAQLIRKNIEDLLQTDSEESRFFSKQIGIFKNVLIHDIDNQKFADIYAQTITYGLFVARMHDNSPETFSRMEAINLLPSTNPFLKEMFDLMVGTRMCDRLKWIVEDLVSVLGASDLRKVLKEYGARQDVVLHFYEDFLKAYDPKLRKNLGVFYTPKAVVNFIVRATDTILENDFGLMGGIANSDKVLYDKKQVVLGKETTEKEEMYKVQILDPALGTGTFLAEVIEQVYAKFANRKAAWQSYVDDCLLERLNGFEYMMSPHTMAHIKLGNLLEETGWQNVGNKKRLNVYLTNSLEEGKVSDKQFSLFEEAIASESLKANQIKANCPVMCVIGNPPYNDKSSNKGKWILEKMNDYKDGLNEQKTHLEDDYMKFIRLGQHYVDKNKSGVLAYITNNGYLFGISQRIMRKKLLESFDNLYIINLHGSAKLKETKAGVEENVFDIEQGVAISIFVKNTNSKKRGTVHYFDLYGTKQQKFDFLMGNSLQSIEWKVFTPEKDDYYFIPTNIKKAKESFSIVSLFREHGNGIQTSRDKLVVSVSKTELQENIETFSDPKYSDEEIAAKYKLKDTRGWNLKQARINVRNNNHNDWIKSVLFRPFDFRYEYYSRQMVDWPREIMPHLLKDNCALIVGRQGQAIGKQLWNLAFVADKLVDLNIYRRGGGDVFPLYLYHNTDLNGTNRTPNLNNEIVEEFEKILGLKFDSEKSSAEQFSPIDLLNYIYGVLYSPSYRIDNQEMLALNYPSIPYPKDRAEFEHFAKCGNQLRQLHLMQNVKVNTEWATMNTTGNNVVEKYDYKDGRVSINKEQYFENVPEEAWNFTIGGYQPAQQWLIDRKNGRPLDWQDMEHYQKIISALMETKRIMDEIDKY